MARLWEDIKQEIPFTFTLCSYTVPAGKTFYLKNLIMSGESGIVDTAGMGGSGYIFPSIAGNDKRGLENFLWNHFLGTNCGIYCGDGGSGRGIMKQPYREGVGNYLGIDADFDGNGIPFNEGETIAIKYIPVFCLQSDVYSFNDINIARQFYLGTIIGKLNDGTRIWIEEKRLISPYYEFWSYTVPLAKKATIKHLTLGITEEWGTGEADVGTILVLIDHKAYRGLSLRCMRGDQVYGASGTVPMAIGTASANHFSFARATKLVEDLVLYEGQIISFAWFYPQIGPISIWFIKNLENVFYKTNYLKGTIIGDLEDVDSPWYGEGILIRETGANARGGSGSCAKLIPFSTDVPLYWKFLVPVTASTNFQLKFWHKISSGFNGSVKVTIYDTDDETKLLDQQSVTLTDDGQYHQYTATGVTPANTGFCRCVVEILNGIKRGVIYIDDIEA